MGMDFICRAKNAINEKKKHNKNKSRPMRQDNEDYNNNADHFDR